MVKRQKWKSLEDQTLKKLILKEKEPIRWELISIKMSEIGINKSSKQCRERWYHQLDPKVEKKKWTVEENKRLFQLHQQIGNKWKDISVHFPGRTDNAIKNNFFSLIRKSLRNACKVLGKISNTIIINTMKPKVLSDYITHKLKIDFSVFNNNIEKTSENEKCIYFQETELMINEFIQKFAFHKFAEIYSKINERDIFVVKKCFEHLIELNNAYIFDSQFKKKTPKKKKNRRHKIKKLKKSYTSIEDTRAKSLPPDEEKGETNESIKFSLTQLKKTDQKNHPIKYYIDKLKKCLKKEAYLKKKYKKEPLELKKKLILQFEEAKEYSEILINRIQLATENDLKQYSKIKKKEKNEKKMKKKIKLKTFENTYNRSENQFFNCDFSSASKKNIKMKKELINSIGPYSGFNSMIFGESKILNDKQNNFNKIFSNRNIKLEPLIVSKKPFMDPIFDEKKKPPVDDFFKSKFSFHFQ